eukprot:9460533-Lingulodinium_polyedra.AAC.1
MAPSTRRALTSPSRGATTPSRSSSTLPSGMPPQTAQLPSWRAREARALPEPGGPHQPGVRRPLGQSDP